MRFFQSSRTSKDLRKYLEGLSIDELNNYATNIENCIQTVTVELKNAMATHDAVTKIVTDTATELSDLLATQAEVRRREEEREYTLKNLDGDNTERYMMRSYLHSYSPLHAFNMDVEKLQNKIAELNQHEISIRNVVSNLIQTINNYSAEQILLETVLAEKLQVNHRAI